MILELSKEVLSKSSWPFCWVSTKKKNLLGKAEGLGSCLSVLF